MRFRTLLVGVALAAATNFSVFGQTHSIAFAAYFGGPIEVDPSIDLPENPTIEQLVKTGNKEIDRLGREDQTLDANQDLKEYLSSLADKLLAAQNIRPPYPIQIHVSTKPELNAYVDAGGQMVFFNDMILQADNEAQLVAILAHEMSHEIHNDYAFFWHAAKLGDDSYGKDGLLAESQSIEQRADTDATRMMYSAGWDPGEQLVMMQRLAKQWQRESGGHRTFYSTHPEDHDRLKVIENAITSLPHKDGLVKDSSRFDEIKKSL